MHTVIRSFGIYAIADLQMLCLAVDLLDEGVQRLAQRIHDEADGAQPVVVQYVSAIKDEGRLDHGLVNGLVVIVLELHPLGQNHDGMRILHVCMGSAWAAQLDAISGTHEHARCSAR